MTVKLLLQKTNLDFAEVRNIQNNLDPLRRQRLRNLNLQIGILASVDGRLSPDNNTYWVQVPQGMDANNTATYSQPFLVRAPTTGGNVQEWAGFPVTLGPGIDGQLEIKGVDAPTFTGAGGVLRKLNPLAAEKRFVIYPDIVPFQSRPVGHAASPSTVVQVRKLWYDDNYGNINRYEGTELAADNVDLVSYIPAADKHRVVVLFLRTTDDTIQVTESTVRDLDEAIVIPDDYEECFAQRDAETMPIQAYRLENADTAIDVESLNIDFRQFINVPQALGFPNPVEGNRIIRSGQTQTVHGDLFITGSLIVAGDLIVHDGDTRVTSEGGTFGDHAAGNYGAFEDDGTLRFEGEGTVWNDLQFSLSGAKVPASNAPTWETFTTNTKEYGFAVDDYIDTEANEVPHSWLLGSQGEVHLHVTTKAANSTGSARFAKFTIYVAYCKNGGTWQETSFTAELTIPDGTAALQLLYLDMGDLTLTGFGLSTEIKLRVKRIAATGGTEYSGNIFLTQAGVHLKDDTLGSRQEAIK